MKQGASTTQLPVSHAGRKENDLNFFDIHGHPLQPVPEYHIQTCIGDNLFNKTQAEDIMADDAAPAVCLVCAVRSDQRFGRGRPL